MEPRQVAKLPGKFNLKDKERVADSNGNIWEWNTEKNEFLYKGQVSTLPDVNEDEDGLVTPDVFRTLELIQELVDKGYKFGKFSLKTDVNNPYYYYFYSSDDLIKFKPEGQDLLRIEIDEARLYQKLMNQCCIGPKGRKGEKGDKGRDGKPALPESFKLTKVEGAKVIIDDIVNAPIDTPLSLRIFDSKKIQLLEILLNIDTKEVSFLIADGVDIEESSLEISYDELTKKFKTVVSFLTPAPAGFYYKLRQRGAKGAPGADGLPFIEIVPELLPDPTMYSTTAIISVRKTGTGNLSYFERNVFEKTTVSRLSATAGALPPRDLLKSYFVAAEVTTRNAKDVGHFDLSKRLVDFPIPELRLPSWTPLSGCGQKTKWNNFKFNWWDYAESAPILKILPSPKPPESCCEQDFFYCPNVGDQPCGVKGPNGVAPTVEMPGNNIQTSCECECENPIELELQSGMYTFPLIDMTDEKMVIDNTIAYAIHSVIDGSSDKFSAEIVFSNAIKIAVKVEPKPEVCGGEAKEKESCAFKSGTKIHMMATVEDISGDVNFKSPQLVETEAFPGTVEFYMLAGGPDITKTRSRTQLVVAFNNTYLELCRGYRLTVAVTNI